MDVAVIKLGVGNTASVMRALACLGAHAELTGDPARVRDAERAILPGVGAANAAVALLKKGGLWEVLRAFPRPLLGVCLGQQLLFEHSEEGDARGLGLIPGNVVALPASRDLPAPHMGWSALSVDRKNPLFEGVGPGEYGYFAHSFMCSVDENTIATAEYGCRFAAAVARGNAFGCQFHPERSGALGARILRNFLALPC